MVNGLDIHAITMAFDSHCTDVLDESAYEDGLDLNCDGTVNEEDLNLHLIEIGFDFSASAFFE